MVTSFLVTVDNVTFRDDTDQVCGPGITGVTVCRVIITLLSGPMAHLAPDNGSFDNSAAHFSRLLNII